MGPQVSAAGEGCKTLRKQQFIFVFVSLPFRFAKFVCSGNTVFKMGGHPTGQRLVRPTARLAIGSFGQRLEWPTGSLGQRLAWPTARLASGSLGYKMRNGGEAPRGKCLGTYRVSKNNKTTKTRTPKSKTGAQAEGLGLDCGDCVSCLFFSPKNLKPGFHKVSLVFGFSFLVLGLRKPSNQDSFSFWFSRGFWFLLFGFWSARTKNKA